MRITYLGFGTCLFPSQFGTHLILTVGAQPYALSGWGGEDTTGLVPRLEE